MPPRAPVPITTNRRGCRSPLPKCKTKFVPPYIESLRDAELSCYRCPMSSKSVKLKQMRLVPPFKYRRCC
jgi:hypothetical protein